VTGIGALWPKTLFGRTAATLALALIVFLALALGALAYFLIVPIAQRSADDLSALMVLSARTWAELPPATRADFARELVEEHGLTIAEADTPLAGAAASHLPYMRFLEAGLTRRSGARVAVHTTAIDGRDWYWAEVPAGGRLLRIGFGRERIGARPPEAALALLAAGAALILLTALLLVRRLTQPLAQLAAASAAVGRGVKPAALPETGAQEIAQLARSFNRMAREVQELLDGRTTLLAGISHDLRTPLARLRLAVAMLPAGADPGLIAGIERDLDSMDRLIGRYLALARGMIDEDVEVLDLRELIDKCVSDARRAGGAVRWSPGAPCQCAVRPTAFERILANLLDNARRHGGGDTEVEHRCDADGAVIRVLDRGPGIPAAQRDDVFRPFHRFDTARASGGSGLGLAIAHQLAEANGWRLDLLARAGGGTEARLVIAGD
jgi:two-component system, OmpR family, osmolarity sensor histidine kinase EnvZ